MTKKMPQQKTIQVNVELHGAHAEMFLAYMERETLRTKAAAGFKLIVNGLRKEIPTRKLAGTGKAEQLAA